MTRQKDNKIPVWVDFIDCDEDGAVRIKGILESPLGEKLDIKLEDGV